MKIAEAFIEVRADTSKFGSQVQKETTSVADKAKSSFKGLLAGAAVGLFAKGAFNELEEAQKSAKQLEQTIKSTGGAAGVTAEHASDLADQISRASTVDDELVANTERILLTFTQIKNTAIDKTFDRATQAAIDLAAGLGGDAQGAALQLGKALNDPLKGITALARAGVSFTAQQKEQIRGFAETGQAAKAQGIILGEVEAQFGGQAAAAATGADKARVAFANLQESVGTALAPAIEGASGAVATLSTAFSAQSTSVQTTELVVLGAAAAYLKFKEPITDAVAALGRWKTGISGANVDTGKLGRSVAGLGAAFAVVGVATVALNKLSDQIADNANQADDVGRVTAELRLLGTTGENTGQLLAATGKDFSGLAADIDEILKSSGGWRKFFDEDRNIGDFWKRGDLQGAKDEVEALDQSLADLASGSQTDQATAAKAFDLITDKLKKQGVSAEDTKKIFGSYNDALGTNAANVKAGVEPTEDLAVAVADVKSEAEKAQDAIDNLTDSISDYVDEVQGAADRSDDFQSSLNDLKDAADDVRKDGKGVFAGTTDEAIAFRDVQRDVVTNAADILTGLTEQDATVRELTLTREALARRYEDEAKKANLPKEAAEAIADAIRGIPVVSKTKFEQPGMEGSLRNTSNLFRKLGEVDGKRVTASVDVDTSAADQHLRDLARRISGFGASGFDFAAFVQANRAAGGPVPEGLTLVGEEGPELLTKHGSQVDVLSNRQTRQAFAGGGGGGLTVNVTVNGAVGDRTALMRYIIDGINEVQGRRAG